MKSFGGLWSQICDLETLRNAMNRAARGKRHRGPVIRFFEDAENQLKMLQSELLSGSYRPAPFSQFKIRDPKPRMISCAVFRDRIVHHATCCVIGPLLERSFIADSYACRVGKGSHSAVLRAQQFARENSYFAKLDIRRYFDSVDHDCLLTPLFSRFREKPLRKLLELIVRFPLTGQMPGKGVPIGNLTSQWFANFYLDAADHLIKEQWGVRGYVRYMDDLLLFDQTREKLEEIISNLGLWLKVERGLEIKIERLRLARCMEGIPFLGWRLFPGFLWLQHGRFHRCRRLIKKREREFAEGAIDEKSLAASVRAICAGIRVLRPRFQFKIVG